MLNKLVENKLFDIVHFVFSTFKVLFSSTILSIVIFTIIAVIASFSTGDWVLGTSFEEWWLSMGAVISDGKFSAIDTHTCWSCALFAKCFDLMSVMGLKLYTYISDIAWTLLTMGFGVWLLMYIYDHIIKEQSSDIKGLLWDIAKKIIVILVLGVALSSGNNQNDEKYLTKMASTIVENTAVPVLNMGIGIGSATLQTDICSKFSYPKTEVDGLITPALKNDMLCLMNTVNVVYLSAMTAGSNMIDMSWKTFINHPISNAKYLPDVVAGLALVVIFFLMYISIPFVLIDIVFTMGILISFLPLMIGGYAYDRTRSFSSTGISSIWGMAFYIIMYCVFLGIIYSSFVYIADMYYPGPLDNFTYLFPDFVYNTMVSGQTQNIMLNEGFKSCYNSAGGDIGKIKTCLLNMNIDFEMPSLDNPGGSFLPMFSFGIISLMIMGSLKTYSKLISGYMMEVGKPAQTFLKSSFRWLASVVRSPDDPEYKLDKKIEDATEKDMQNTIQKINETAEDTL